MSWEACASCGVQTTNIDAEEVCLPCWEKLRAERDRLRAALEGARDLAKGLVAGGIISAICESALDSEDT